MRHGETAGNYAKKHQTFSISLNERGREQVKNTAITLSQLPIDTLITSDVVRAKETAEIISKEIHIASQVDSLFRELRRSKTIEDKHHFGFLSIISSVLMYLHAKNKEWHYADGENLLEFRDRVMSALNTLTKIDGEYIVVVAHRGVINALRFGAPKNFSSSIERFMFTAVLGRLKNGSITKLTYDSSCSIPWHFES